jgi:hypothetical protein
LCYVRRTRCCTVSGRLRWDGAERRTSKLTPAQRHANRALSAARASVEHGFSDLKNWRILTRFSPANVTMLLRALRTLTRQHTSR